MERFGWQNFIISQMSKKKAGLAEYNGEDLLSLLKLKVFVACNLFADEVKKQKGREWRPS